MEKRRKNYWVSFLLALLLLFGGTSSALAATADVEIENLTGDSAIAEKQTGITVDIVVKNHPSFRGADFNITYPTEVFAKCNGGQTMDGSTWMIGNITPGTGSVNVLLAGSASQVPAAAETTFVQLSFDAADSIPDGSYKFAITYDETDSSKGILDDTMTPLELTITGGDIEIARAPKVTATVSTAAETGTIAPADVTTYEAGQTPTYTITPADGYRVKTFTVGGQDRLADISNGTAGGTFTFTTALVEGDNIAIDVAFELIPRYTVTASAGENGTISDAGEMTYDEGVTPTYTVTPDAHYEVDTFQVLGDDTAALTDNGDGTYSYTYAAIAADSTIAVTFKIKQYAVTVTAGENGAISPAEETLYSALSTPAYTITPDTANNYVIDTVTVDGADVTGTENYVLNEDKSAVYTFSALEGPAALAVTFKLGVFEIAITEGSGGSIVAVDNDIVDGVVTVIAGADQKFKVKPDEGYSIKKVKVDGELQDVPDASAFTYTFPAVDKPHTFLAKFELLHTITASATPAQGGTIDPSGEIGIADGESLDFTITLNDGWDAKLYETRADQEPVELASYTDTGEYTYTLANVTEDLTVELKFMKDGTYHAADCNMDGDIGTVELLEFMELYLDSADGYHYDPEVMSQYQDCVFGYAAGGPAEGEDCVMPHSADCDGDCFLSINEYLRVVELWQAGGYVRDMSVEECGGYVKKQ